MIPQYPRTGLLLLSHVTSIGLNTPYPRPNNNDPTITIGTQRTNPRGRIKKVSIFRFIPIFFVNIRLHTVITKLNGIKNIAMRVHDKNIAKETGTMNIITLSIDAMGKHAQQVITHKQFEGCHL
mmetsp:Transcript_9084/g.10087  ORF Transcript_9084/g.10087 Transcript_9084/m.10087 type:complete len:124 (+) Transcript_9084:159-530(+)